MRAPTRESSVSMSGGSWAAGAAEAAAIATATTARTTLLVARCSLLALLGPRNEKRATSDETLRPHIGPILIDRRIVDADLEKRVVAFAAFAAGAAVHRPLLVARGSLLVARGSLLARNERRGTRDERAHARQRELKRHPERDAAP